MSNRIIIWTLLILPSSISGDEYVGVSLEVNSKGRPECVTQTNDGRFVICSVGYADACEIICWDREREDFFRLHESQLPFYYSRHAVIPDSSTVLVARTVFTRAQERVIENWKPDQRLSILDELPPFPEDHVHTSRIEVWDLAKRVRMARLDISERVIHRIVVTSNGSNAVIVGRTKTYVAKLTPELQLWRTLERDQTHGAVMAACFSTDAERLFTLSTKGALTCHRHPAYDVGLRVDQGKRLDLESNPFAIFYNEKRDGVVALSSRRNEGRLELQVSGLGRYRLPVSSDAASYQCFAVNTTGDLMVVGHSDGNVTVVNPFSGIEVEGWNRKLRAAVSAVSFSADCKSFITASAADGTSQISIVRRKN